MNAKQEAILEQQEKTRQSTDKLKEKLANRARNKARITTCPICARPRFSFKNGTVPLVCHVCNDRYKKEAEEASEKVAEALMEGKEAGFPGKLEWVISQIDIKRFEREVAEAEKQFNLLRGEAEKLLEEKKAGNYLDSSIYKALRNKCFEAVGANKAYGAMKRLQDRHKEAERLLKEGKVREKSKTDSEAKKEVKAEESTKTDSKAAKAAKDSKTVSKKLVGKSKKSGNNKPKDPKKELAAVTA